MHAPPGSLPPRPDIVNGKVLRRVLHDAQPAVRAAVAAQLVRGELVVLELSAVQAARLCGVGPGIVGKMLGRSPRRRTDAELDHLVEHVGPDRLMAALDRATTPVTN